MVKFYVYAYIDPRDGTPFYIGKGHGDRDRQHTQPSRIKARTFFYYKLRKMLAEGVQPVTRRLLEDLTEDEAFYFEAFFVSSLGRRDLNTGCLCNLTAGGDGCSGTVVSAETRRKISKVWKGKKRKPFSSEHLRKMSVSRLGVKRKPHTDETRRKMSDAHKGKTLTVEHRRKLAQAKLGHKRTPQMIARHGFSMWKRHGGIVQPLDPAALREV